MSSQLDVNVGVGAGTRVASRAQELVAASPTHLLRGQCQERV